MKYEDRKMIDKSTIGDFDFDNFFDKETVVFMGSVMVITIVLSVVGLVIAL
jgi:hypothetical protein